MGTETQRQFYPFTRGQELTALNVAFRVSLFETWMLEFFRYGVQGILMARLCDYGVI
jgi:hypothetical protein